MALYSGMGDAGKTTLFACDQKMMKSSAVIEALGALDELNSLLGVCKVSAAKNKNIRERIAKIQNDLFILQAIIAGADKKFPATKTKAAEKIIDQIERELPKIKNFVVSGGTELSALLDYARAVARRAERRVVAVTGKNRPSKEIIRYLNRLSSLLFALARFANRSARIEEKGPRY